MSLDRERFWYRGLGSGLESRRRLNKGAKFRNVLGFVYLWWDIAQFIRIVVNAFYDRKWSRELKVEFWLAFLRALCCGA